MKNMAIHMIVSKGNQHLFEIYFANRCLQKNDQEWTQDILRKEIHIILFEKSTLILYSIFFGNNCF